MLAWLVTETKQAYVGQYRTAETLTELQSDCSKSLIGNEVEFGSIEDYEKEFDDQFCLKWKNK